MYIPYGRKHGQCLVALIALQGYPKRFYHYSKIPGQPNFWAIRDYITGEILRSEPNGIPASEVEKLVIHAESAKYRAVGKIAEWKQDCKTQSQKHFGQVDETTPNPDTLGKWRSMSPSGN